MRIFSLCFALFIGFSPLVSAQMNGLYILDGQTKMPVLGAEIRDSSAELLEVSNDLGFVPVSFPEGARLHVSAFGYAQQSLVYVRDTVVCLQPAITQLSEVQITGKAEKAHLSKLAQLDLHLRPVQSAQDVLRIVPGLFIGQHAGGGKAEQIFLRGFDIDHGTDVRITADGLPVNLVSHAHGQGYADLHFVIPELIEQVDFNKGPYFAEKGNFTTAGYVDLRTRRILDRSFVKVEGGQFETGRLVAAVNLLPSQARARNQHVYAAIEISGTQGFFDAPQDFRRLNGVLKYQGQVHSQHILHAMVSGFSSRWNASGQIPDRAVAAGTIGYFGAIDPTEGGQTHRTNAQLELISSAHDGGLFKNQVFYSNYGFELYSNFTFFKENPVEGDQIRQREQRQIFGYNGRYEKQNTLFGTSGRLEAGVQIRADLVEDVELSRTKLRSITLQPVQLGNVQEVNSAAFLAQSWNLRSNLQLTTALRYDHFSHQYKNTLENSDATTSTQFLSPKLNLNWQVSRNLELYLYNGRGFHSNDTRVAVKREGKTVLPAAYGTDLGVITKLGNRAILQAALWQLWLAQEFVYVGDEGIVEAGSPSQRLGLDVSLRYQIMGNLFTDFDLTYAQPRSLEVPDNERFIPLAPRFAGTGSLVFRQQKGLNASLRSRWLGDRAANETNTLIAAGYFITDLNCSYLFGHSEIGLSIQNLFNQKWKETQFETETQLRNETEPVSEIHFTPGTPFAAKLSFTYRF
jgi:outer membrane receptor protein involved in Fe transport